MQSNGPGENDEGLNYMSSGETRENKAGTESPESGGNHCNQLLRDGRVKYEVTAGFLPGGWMRVP